jgi:AcrR family transcriptional regulator
MMYGATSPQAGASLARPDMSEAVKLNTARVGRPRKRADSLDASLTRETIIKAALAQIDGEGLESFSLRTLASRLGVTPNAIYWYVPNRNELLALLVTEILGKVVPERRRRNWQQQLRDLFVNFREAVATHPNVAPLIGTQLVSNSTLNFSMVECILDALTRAGLSDQKLVGAYNSVVASLAGFIAQEFAPIPEEDSATWQLAVQQRLLGIDREAFPILAANLSRLANHAFILRWQNGVDAPLDDSFSTFVEVVISGIEVLCTQS